MTKLEHKPFDQIGQMIAWEAGELDTNGMVLLFAELIKSGLCWKLQRTYGQQADTLISKGIVSTKGTIDYDILRVVNKLSE